MSEPFKFSLRFMSGKYQGGEFPLEKDTEIIVGRSSELGMVLVEDMVSRQHARISCTADRIFISDLGSTNGTFVNGEKIDHSEISEGDRVLIGTSILKLIPADGRVEAGKLTMPEKPGEEHQSGSYPMGSGGTQTVSGGRSMSGTIDEIPLPDLLQLLTTSRKSGVLSVQSGDQVGNIYLREGKVYHATLTGSHPISQLKAVYRMIVWNTGTFELRPPDETSCEEELDVTIEGLLMEALRQFDEIGELGDGAPPSTSALAVKTPLPVPLRELSADELDTVEAVLTHGLTGVLLDRSPTTDLETYQSLAKLIKREIIVVSA